MSKDKFVPTASGDRTRISIVDVPTGCGLPFRKVITGNHSLASVDVSVLAEVAKLHNGDAACIRVNDRRSRRVQRLDGSRKDLFLLVRTGEEDIPYVVTRDIRIADRHIQTSGSR